MADSVKSFRGLVWKDRGWEALRKRWTSGPAVIHAQVGVVGAAASQPHPLRDGDLSIEEVALLNEFGGSQQPERSFLRRTFMWNKSAHRELLSRLAEVTIKTTFRGIDRAIAMKDVGEWGVKKVKATIMSNIGPQNSEATIEKKGKATTLRDSLTLLNSISYVIKGVRAALGGSEDSE